MNDLINAFIAHVKETSGNPDFIHHKWFVKWHLEIVERMALELCDEYYPEANRELVRVLAWLHDYGKTLDFDNQCEVTLQQGRAKLTEIGFEKAFVDTAIAAMEIIDRKDREELEAASIEVKIISSADAASHHVGPFFPIYWLENADKSLDELMQADILKTNKDWQRKMVLPEVRNAFEVRHQMILEMGGGQLPEKFFA